MLFDPEILYNIVVDSRENTRDVFAMNDWQMSEFTNYMNHVVRCRPTGQDMEVPSGVIAGEQPVADQEVDVELANLLSEIQLDDTQEAMRLSMDKNNGYAVWIQNEGSIKIAEKQIPSMFKRIVGPKIKNEYIRNDCLKKLSKAIEVIRWACCDDNRTCGVGVESTLHALRAIILRGNPTEVEATINDLSDLAK